MGTPAQGFKKYVQIGMETTWGTAVPATRKLGIVSESFNADVSSVESATMDGEVVVSDLYMVKEMARGTITFELNYVGQLLLLDMCFGTATFGSLGGVTTGAGPYTHVYNPRSILNSYTIEIFKDIPTGKCHRLIGAKVVGWRIVGAAGTGDGAVLKLEMDIVAKKIETNQTPTGALSVVLRQPVLFHHATTVDDGLADTAADVRVRSFNLSVESALHEDRDYLGSITPDEFLRADRVKTKLNLVKELQTRSLLDRYKAGLAGSPQLIFTSGTMTVTIDMPNAKIPSGGYSESQNGYGIETQEVTWQAIQVVASSPVFDLRLTVANTESAIT